MPAKKTKFVTLQTAATSQSPIFPGRQRCECQAIKHDLVNNCLSCGRIVCVQEGAGPCTFCGELVLTKSERAKMSTGNTKEAERLIAKYKRQSEKEMAEAERQKAAQATKDRLLEYDRTTASRTKVIDDQSDYFASENPWLSEQEKGIMKKKQEAYDDMKNRLKRKTKVTIDFAGRRIIEEAPEMPNFDDPAFQITAKKQGSDRMTSDGSRSEIVKPEFVGELEKMRISSSDGQGKKDTPIFWSNRIQDAELQEMVDAGNCLSVLQPYASLIIEGIKQFEGRTWYTPVRGRLWICSGNKPPTTDVIKQVEASYRMIAGEDVTFPTSYNCGCLLGCVDLVDCIPNEEYLEIYPHGEVTDPYVFVMANPKILTTRLPIQPKNNIFKLDRSILQATKNGLR